MIGTRLNIGTSEYELNEIVARGSFGTLYKAVPVSGVGVRLAVKVPAQHIISEPKWARKFEREARILANLDHPNIVKIVGLVPLPDGSPALVQEFIENAVELVSLQSSGDGEYLSIALQVLYGLRATHGTSDESRAVHRDLSPRNILVQRPSGVVKIIDFGLAKEDPRTTTILTTTGEWFGTPGCMAPEQCRDSANVDHRADLYALGRTLAATMQSRRPEHVDTSRLPEPWRQIVEQLCAYEVGDRFVDAKEAIARLLHDFADLGILPTCPAAHFKEFSHWDEIPNAWPRVARDYFLAPAPPHGAIELARLLGPSTLDDAEFKIDLVFDALDAKVVAPAFDPGTALFEDCDPIARIYENWYSALDSVRKLAAFQHLARIALRYHRYPVMDALRGIYARESDVTMRDALKKCLDVEDPAHVVHGRGIIPGRD